LVAQAAFPKGNRLLKLRNELGSIYADEQFTALYPGLGQPAFSLGRLALATVLQFMEDLIDREAAEAVHSCIDWKYLLSLELQEPGFDYSFLSEFHQRLIEHAAEHTLLDQLLVQCQTKGLLKKGKQRTDSTRVLAAFA
jgi:transposase